MADIGAPDVTGSIPDVVGMVLGLSQAMSASAGFNCNSCTFPLTRPPPAAGGTGSSAAGRGATQNAEPASSATPRAGGSSARPVEFGRGSPFLSVRQPRTVTESFLGEPQVVSAPLTIELGLRTIASDNTYVCTVELRHLEGWDTQIGDQMSLELVPTDIGNGVVLSIFGFADPAGAGFGRFYGSIFVEPQPLLVTTVPIGDMAVTANTNRFRAQRTAAGFELLLFDNRRTLDLWDRGRRAP